MGPGRWGSRGDIKLGVNVSYSDINNTAMLIEIARQTGDYLPDLSFGTHFFQDLVESEIRYLPLYPDADSTLNQRLLHSSPNLLVAMLPEYAHLADTVRVVDIPSASGGRVLRVLMNSELDEAIGMLASPEEPADQRLTGNVSKSPANAEEFWRWRMQMADHIASELDPDRFGVVAMYVIGSTKNASAGPASDIDLLIHHRGTDEQRRELEIWLQGWSLALGKVNYLADRVLEPRVAGRPHHHRRRRRTSGPRSPPRSVPSPTPPSNCRWEGNRPEPERCARSDQFPRSGRQVGRIEPHDRQLGPVVGGAETVGPTDHGPPGTGDSRRFVNVTVQGRQGLFVFDEALDGDAADVDVQWHVIDHAAVERGPVEGGPVRRRVEQAESLVRDRAPRSADRGPPRWSRTARCRHPPGRSEHPVPVTRTPDR